AVDESRAGLGVRHDVADGDVRRPGDHGLHAPAAVFDGRELELVRIGVLLQLRDAPDVHLVAPRAADALDVVGLDAGHVQALGDLLRRRVDGHVLAQPRERDAQGRHYTLSR